MLFLYALATAGRAGVANLLNLIEKEMKVAMTLTGAKSISEITQDSLVQELSKAPAARWLQWRKECSLRVR